MKGKRVEGGPETLPYKMEMQKRGVSLPNQQAKHCPMSPTPVSKTGPGLGAKTISHPYLKGKEKI